MNYKISNNSEDAENGIKLVVPVYPHDRCSSLVHWVINTRRYIETWQYHDYVNGTFSDKQILPLSPEKVSELNKIENESARVGKLTAYIIFPEYTIDSINHLLENQDSRYIGIALSIEKGLIENILKFGESQDIFLLLTERQLCSQELCYFQEPSLIKKIAERIVDPKQTMYTMLVANFQKILTEFGYNVIDDKFIKKYLKHGLFFQDLNDSFFKNVLENAVEKHPKFSELDCLSWDVFTKSRRYSHWLAAIRKMDRLMQYYEDIPNCHVWNQLNIDYINKYKEFKIMYKDCFY